MSSCTKFSAKSVGELENDFLESAVTREFFFIAEKNSHSGGHEVHKWRGERTSADLRLRFAKRGGEKIGAGWLKG